MAVHLIWTSMSQRRLDHLRGCSRGWQNAGRVRMKQWKVSKRAKKSGESNDALPSGLVQAQGSVETGVVLPRMSLPRLHRRYSMVYSHGSGIVSRFALFRLRSSTTSPREISTHPSPWASPARGVEWPQAVGDRENQACLSFL